MHTTKHRSNQWIDLAEDSWVKVRLSHHNRLGTQSQTRWVGMIAPFKAAALLTYP
jgi:hypothetical protein